ncbi:hypothetical protein M0R45_008187 [Rubus argutus]|uniref:Protein kinase domain-containing protein n=1 Tax=Rubus argutus TaxID=59490 RepID=A0AAW1Y3C3_RUBAR
MGFLLAETVISYFSFPWKKTKPKQNQNWPFTEGKCTRFSLDEIIAATGNFKEYLGSGVFNDVYKGNINNGTTPVVIKRLQKYDQIRPESAFETEILLFCQLRHPNLVSFIGFCEEGDDRMLVYEFLDNGPLSNHLFYKTPKDSLSWKKRLSICIGGCTRRTLPPHRDEACHHPPRSKKLQHFTGQRLCAQAFCLGAVQVGQY